MLIIQSEKSACTGLVQLPPPHQLYLLGPSVAYIAPNNFHSMCGSNEPGGQMPGARVRVFATRLRSEHAVPHGDAVG